MFSYYGDERVYYTFINVSDIPFDYFEWKPKEYNNIDPGDSEIPMNDNIKMIYDWIIYSLKNNYEYGYSKLKAGLNYLHIYVKDTDRHKNYMYYTIPFYLWLLDEDGGSLNVGTTRESLCNEAFDRNKETFKYLLVNNKKYIPYLQTISDVENFTYDDIDCSYGKILIRDEILMRQIQNIEFIVNNKMVGFKL